MGDGSCLCGAVMPVVSGDMLGLDPPEKATLVYLDPPYMTGRDFGEFDAAKRLGRRWWGCDVNPGAVRLAEGRLADTMGEPQLW